MTAYLYEPKQLWLIIVVLFGVIVALGAGKGLGAVLSPLIKKALGKGDFTVNVGGSNEVAPPGLTMVPCLIDPNKCPGHGEEKGRSLKNESAIEELKNEFHSYREIFFKEIRATRRGISKIAVALVAQRIINPQDFPKEGD